LCKPWSSPIEDQYIESRSRMNILNIKQWAIKAEQSLLIGILESFLRYYSPGSGNSQNTVKCPNWPDSEKSEILEFEGVISLAHANR
jgi:hypothetical protein